MYTTHRAILLAICFTLSSSVSAEDAAVDRPEFDGEKRLATLKMLIAQMRGNYEALQTVSGQYSFSDAFRFDGQIPGLVPGDQVRIEQVINPDLDKLISPPAGYEKKHYQGERPSGDDDPHESAEGYWSVARGVIGFDYDSTRDRYHVFYEPRQPAAFKDIPTGRWYQWTTNGDFIHWILTPEHFIEFDIVNTYGQLAEFPPASSLSPNGGRVVLRQPSSMGKQITRFFHFRDMFSDGLWLHHEFIEVFCSETGIKNVKLLGPGVDAPGIYTFRKNSSYGPIIIVLDESVGFNAVRHQLFDKDGRLMIRRDITYRDVDGVFVPDQYRVVKNSETNTEYVRQFTLGSVTINEPIDDAEFGFEQFNLKYGERMHDQIENSLAFYDGEKFVDSERFEVDKGKLDWRMTPDGPITVSPAMTPPADRPSSFKTLLIGVNVLAIIVIAVFVLRQKR